MLKITAVMSLLLIGGAWSSGLSCESCGSECAAACGTRHFRACCFNYLRKKRTDAEHTADALKSWRRGSHSAQDRFEERGFNKNPFLSTEEAIDSFFLKPAYTMKDFDPNSLEDTLQNRMLTIYDA